MNLIITIDTEEDNWDKYSRTENPCANIEKLTSLQELFDRYNVKPTYLVSYPVATDPNAISILKEFLKNDKCEIGTHCHPWNTPPFEEEMSLKNTMLSNLPYDIVFKKIKVLHETIQKNLGVTLIAFRAGRFSFDNKTARAICALGYKIDTSITPYEDQTPYLGPDFSDFSLYPYRFNPEDISKKDPNGVLMEIPITNGFLQRNFYVTNVIEKFFKRKPMKFFKIIGILNTLHLLNPARLMPEISDSKSMISFVKLLVRKKDTDILNMMFHSTSLMSGFNDFVKNRNEETRFSEKIEIFLKYIKTTDIKPIKLTEYYSLQNSNKRV